MRFYIQKTKVSVLFHSKFKNYYLAVVYLKKKHSQLTVNHGRGMAPIFKTAEKPKTISRNNKAFCIREQN